MNQQTALEILKSGRNVFLTGPAGSGKTFLLNSFIAHLRENGVRPVVTASTGISATHMNGVTIHSWSGLGIKDRLSDEDLEMMARNMPLRMRVGSAKVLIIDEISMLHAHQLDIVDRICRRFKHPDQPFGGLQVIFSGDFFQLPPVSRGPRGSVAYAYESEIWGNMDLAVCYLDGQYRQKSGDLLGILSDIRQGSVNDRTWQLIYSRQDIVCDADIKPTRLFTHNRDVDFINLGELALIDEDAHYYRMQDKGHDKLIELLKKSCLAPEELVLKKGAQVMFVKNNYDKGYVNGTMGVVTGFDEQEDLPIIMTTDGDEITVEQEKWVIEDEGGKTLASIKQIPLRLAWAITVHKSQGMSLDSAEIDLSKSFEYGMGYVALSRVRSLDGLFLKGIHPRSLNMHPKVVQLDGKLREQSEKLEEELRNV